MAAGIKEQIEAFLTGFHQLIPNNLISIFDSHELELMISGIPVIDSKSERNALRLSLGPQGEHGAKQLHEGQPDHSMALGSSGEL